MSSSHEKDWLRESEEIRCALIEIAAQRDDARRELAALRAELAEKTKRLDELSMAGLSMTKAYPALSHAAAIGTVGAVLQQHRERDRDAFVDSLQTELASERERREAAERDLKREQRCLRRSRNATRDARYSRARAREERDTAIRERDELTDALARQEDWYQEACSERDKAQVTLRKYEDTLCFPDSPLRVYQDGHASKTVEPLRVGDLLAQCLDAEKQRDTATALLRDAVKIYPPLAKRFDAFLPASAASEAPANSGAVSQSLAAAPAGECESKFIPCGLCDEHAKRVTEAGEYRCPRGHWINTNQSKWRHPEPHTDTQQREGSE